MLTIEQKIRWIMAVPQASKLKNDQYPEHLSNFIAARGTAFLRWPFVANVSTLPLPSRRTAAKVAATNSVCLVDHRFLALEFRSTQALPAYRQISMISRRLWSDFLL